MLSDLTIEAPLTRDGFDGYVRRSVRGSTSRICHRHAEHEFNLVVRGGGSYVLRDGVSLDLRPGALVWMFSGQEHRLVRSPDLEMWVVVAKPELIGDDMRSDAAARRAFRMLDGNEAILLERLLEQVAGDARHPDVFNQGLKYALSRAWRATYAQPEAARDRMHPAVRQALLLMRGDDPPTSLSDYARLCRVAPSHLSRLIARDTGRSFVEWRNRTRLDRFHRSRAAGEKLLAAALGAGFGSYSQFHRVFREATGATPGAYPGPRHEPEAAGRAALDALTGAGPPPPASAPPRRCAGRAR